jgi:phosphoadenosine phosphosulfate reductase
MNEKETLALSRIYEYLDKNVAVSFSGGKDSLVVLDLAIRAGINRVVFANTSIEFDETLEYVNAVEDFYGIKIDVVKAPVTFLGMIDTVDLPSRRFRWCCEVFKFGPLGKYAIDKQLYGFFTGLRHDESRRRKKYDVEDTNPVVLTKQINPIIEWKEQDVWNYIKKYNLVINPLYEHFDRVGCWCCPYRSDDEWEIIKQIHPDKAEIFERKLLNFAEKMSIKDKNEFVDKRGWRSWASPSRKITIGAYSPCKAVHNGKIDIILSLENEDQSKRIIKMLPVLTDNFFQINKRIRVTINKDEKTKLNILVEKALNCVSCGACLSLCRSGALHLDDKSVVVNDEKCVHCEKCIRTNILRGSCISRNYSNKRLALSTN